MTNCSDILRKYLQGKEYKLETIVQGGNNKTDINQWLKSLQTNPITVGYRMN